MQIKEFIKKITDSRNTILLIIIFALGIGIRTIAIDQWPNALNQDEVSSGYEAWSILNYGVDRNGKKLPVFLIAWGDGQNALYTYLMIPFVKVLGLNVWSTRLPMCIIGCVSLIVMYFLLKELKDEKTALIGTAFLAICPWHIMKSRFGLESNLLPDLILWSVYLIIKAIKDKKLYKLYIAAVILGLSAYTYGTSYMFLPIFTIFLLILLLKKKKINIKEAIIFIAIIAIISMPIIICIIINLFDLPEISLPFMTIPKCISNKYETETSIFNGSILANLFINFKNSLKILYTQYDNLGWNAISGVGTIYIFSIVFVIVGILKQIRDCIKKQTEVSDSIMLCWLLSALPLLFIFNFANINRTNILFFPLIYYAIIGIEEIIEKVKFTKWIILVLFCISFAIFLNKYFNMNSNKFGVFNGYMREVMSYVEKIDNTKTVYFQPKRNNATYIYFLFYLRNSPYEFCSTVKKSETNNVIGYLNYNFVDKVNLEKNPNNVYIILNNEQIDINEKEWQIDNIGVYKSLQYKGEK